MSVYFSIVLVSLFFILPNAVRASGVLPETSAIYIYESEGEASIGVKNTETQPTLLYTEIQDVPEDRESLVVATPPVARVEPNKTQLVRFILTNREPLKEQRFKRVSFEGVMPETDRSQVGIAVRQNLPLIIHPKGLKHKDDPWTGLLWRSRGGSIVVENPSPYVVRLNQQAELLPIKVPFVLPRTYVLPGEKLEILLHEKDGVGVVPAEKFSEVALKVRIYPVTAYGFSASSYDAPLDYVHVKEM